MANKEPLQRVRLRPYSPRIDVHQQARLTDEAGKTHDVFLADISRDGFRIKCNGANIIAGPAMLHVERYGDVPVELRWIRHKEAGGMFLDRAPEIL